MDKRFFFITTYDKISGAILTSLLNCHPEIHCNDKSPNKKTVDDLIKEGGNEADKFYGDTQSYSAHALQNAILAERTRLPLRKMNLAVSPGLRIHFLMLHWLDKYKTAEAAITQLGCADILCSSAQKNDNTNYATNQLNAVFRHVTASAAQENVDLEKASNMLFLFALAKVVTQDTLDFLAPGKSINLEKILQDKNN